MFSKRPQMHGLSSDYWQSVSSFSSFSSSSFSSSRSILMILIFFIIINVLCSSFHVFSVSVQFCPFLSFLSEGRAPHWAQISLPRGGGPNPSSIYLVQATSILNPIHIKPTPRLNHTGIYSNLLVHIKVMRAFKDIAIYNLLRLGIPAVTPSGHGSRGGASCACHIHS